MAKISFAEASKGWDTFEPDNSIFGAADGGFTWMEGDSLAPPCQTDMDVVEAILAFANLDEKSILYDLGCGDGRICILGSKMYGCRSTGAEIEELLVNKFKANVAKEKVHSLVTVEDCDLREIKINDATHIVLYLLPESIEELTPRLVDALNNGTILVCNTWGPKSFQPVEHRVCGQDNQINLYKYSRESIPNIEAMMMRRHDSEPMDMDQLDKDMDVGA